MTLAKLKGLREKERLIREIREEIAELNAGILPGGGFSGVPSSSGSGQSRVESYVFRKIALEERLKAQEEELGRDVIEVYEFIETVEDGERTAEIRKILRLKFVRGCTWTQVAAKMGRADMGEARRSQFWRWAAKNLEDCGK